MKAALLVGMALCLVITYAGRSHAASVIVTDGRDGSTISEWHDAGDPPPVNPAYVRASALCHRQADPAAVAACMMHVNSAFIVIR